MARALGQQAGHAHTRNCLQKLSSIHRLLVRGAWLLLLGFLDHALEPLHFAANPALARR